MAKCAWCNEPSIGTVVLEPARWGIDKQKQIRVMKKSAKTALVCKNHLNIIELQPLFYSCGCSYEKGFDTCPMHNRRLRNKPKQNYADVQGAGNRSGKGPGRKVI